MVKMEDDDEGGRKKGNASVTGMGLGWVKTKREKILLEKQTQDSTQLLYSKWCSIKKLLRTTERERKRYSIYERRLQ